MNNEDKQKILDEMPDDIMSALRHALQWLEAKTGSTKVVLEHVKKDTDPIIWRD